MIRLRSLGHAVVELDKERVTPAAGGPFALLLYASLERGRAIPRTELASLLWPDVDESSRQHSLRQTAYLLRRLGATVESNRKAIWIPKEVVDCDATSIVEATGTAAAEQLAERIGGRFLPGYEASFSAEFTRWLEQQRDVAHAAARRVLIAAIAAKRARGEWVDVERLARRCLDVDPLNEEATLSLAEAAAMHGSKVRALEIVDRYLVEMGPEARDIRLPAALLRRRIAESAPHQTNVCLPAIPMVGRASELATLNNALQQMSAGQGCVYLVWGEPGIGKTRLATEFSRAAELQRVRVATVRCSQSDARRPLSIFADLAPLVLAMPGALGCTPQSLAYLRALVEHDVGSDDVLPSAADVARSSHGIHRAILDVLDAVAGEGPLLVIVEDVHWGEERSRDLLAELASWTTTRRVMFVLTSRRADVVRTNGAPPEHLRSIALAPLAECFGRDLVRAVTAALARPFHEDFSKWCLEVGGGNPFFLTELSLENIGAGNAPQVPSSIISLLRSRLAQLSADAKRVLQAIVLLGADATIARLVDVLQMNRLPLLDALDELSRSWLIECKGDVVRHRHDLLADAAREDLSPASRQLLHRTIAEMLQQELERSRSSALMWRCAEHWQEAGDHIATLEVIRSCAQHSVQIGFPEKAAEVMERAIRRARIDVRNCRLHAERAVEYYDLALDAIGSSPPSAFSVEILSGKAAALMHRLGRGADAEAVQRECVKIARDLGDPSSLAAALSTLASILNRRGDHERAQIELEEAIRLATIAGDCRRLGPPVHEMSLVWRNSGDFAMAVEMSQRALMFYEECGDEGGMCLASIDVGANLHELGRFAEAEQFTRIGADAARRLRYVQAEAMARLNLTETLALRGELEEAQREASLTLALANEHGWPQLNACASLAFGILRRHQGRVAEAKGFFAEAVIFAKRADYATLKRWGEQELSSMHAEDTALRAKFSAAADT